MTLPADLNINGKPDPSNKDYYEITINPLNLVTTYAFQFQWIFEDKKLNEEIKDTWSNIFKLTTIADTINKPQFRAIDLDYTGNTIIVSWTGKDYLGANYKDNLQRIDIWAKGSSFGSEYKVVGSFQKAGSQTITAAAGQYYVKLQAVSNSGGVSLFSDEQTILTESPLIVDLTPPDNPTNPGVTSGVDPNDQTGFSAYATFSWTHHPNADTNGTRGYRIRWTYDTENPIYEYGFVDYPNNSYTATGLIPNVQYSFQVASVDQFNNTQSYLPGGTFTAVDPTNPDGWARLKSYISIGGATGDLFKFGTGIATSINTSLTTTPSLSSNTYNGIILNKTGNNNNYWLTTGQFRVGGNTQFMYWDGTNLSITGDLGVGGSATVAGHLFMKTSGASIYSGQIVNDTLPEGTRGFVLNNNGLLVQDNGIGANRKYVRLDPTTGTIFANNAQIEGALIITSGATKDAIDGAQADADAAADAAAAAQEDAADAAEAAAEAAAAVAGKLDTVLFSKSQIIDKLNDGNGGTTVTGSVISTGAIISNNVAAGERGIRGETFTGNGSIYDLDNGTISTKNFRINGAGDIFMKGSLTSGSSINGAEISGGSLSISGADSFFPSVVQTVAIQNGNINISATGESIFSNGAIFISGRNFGNQPTSSALSSSTLSFTDPSGDAIMTMNGTGRLTIYTGAASGWVDIGFGTNFTNLNVSGRISTQGGLSGGTSIATGTTLTNATIRNISAGTGAKTSSDTDGLLGDIFIQYS